MMSILDPGSDMDPDPGSDMDPEPGSDMEPEPGSDMDPDPGSDMDPFIVRLSTKRCEESSQVKKA